MTPERDVLPRLLGCVPMWMRTRWPLRRFYWQAEQMESIRRAASELEAIWHEREGTR